MYAFPPDGLFDNGHTMQSLIVSAYPLFSLVVVAAEIWYIERRASGRPGSRWMVVNWLVALIVELILFRLYSTHYQPMEAFGFLALLPLIVGLFVIFHCVVTVVGQKGPQARSARRKIHWGALSWSIGGLLLAVIFLAPGVESRRIAKRSQCRNNLRQLNLGFISATDIQGHLPDSLVQVADGPARSWRIEMLPYVDQTPRYLTYDQSKAWDAAPNLSFASVRLNVYSCPTVPKLQQTNSIGQYYTAYTTLTGPNTCFPNGKGLVPNRFTDGLSHTALAAEACGYQIVWSEPRDIEVTAENVGVNLPGKSKYHSPGILSSYHQGGAQLMMADGSVRFVSNNTDPAVLQALITPAGDDQTEEF